MTLTFAPAGWFQTVYRVLDAGGQDLGVVDLDVFRSAGTLTLAGARYRVEADSLDGALVLRGPDGLPRMQAASPSLVSLSYTLDWGDGQGHLRRRSIWPFAPLDVEDGSGERVAVIEGGLWVRQRLRVGTVEGWPLDRAVFVGVLGLFVRRRQRRRSRGA